MMKSKICLVSNASRPRNEPQAIEYSPWIDEDEDYIRVSEVIEVELPMLDRDEYVPKQVTAIEAKINRVRASMSGQIAELEKRKSELLAITHEAD